MEIETITARDISCVTLKDCGREVSYETLRKKPVYLADVLAGIELPVEFEVV